MTMKKTLNLFALFGTAYAISVFEALFTGWFDHQNGLNLTQVLVAGLVGAFGAKVGQMTGKRVIARYPGAEFWRLDWRRWVLPFLLALIVLPLTGIAVGYWLRANPVVLIVLTVSNFILTPVVYGVVAVVPKKDRLAHVCFTALSIWLIGLPFSIANQQPLQTWFAAFTSMGLLAIAGYLIAQGLNAIRGKPVVL